ncbi:MAG: hypothetical protein NC218_10685 [Acetobacter sp.]|nr:hypothetical protein [Acetobacter sp.]
MTKTQKIILVAVIFVAAAAGVYMMNQKTEVIDAPKQAAVEQPATTETAPVAAELAADRVYVMYAESCPMCIKALKYIDKKYADNEYVVKVNLNTEEGKAMLNTCRQKFGFTDVVIPLICAKDSYFMGWSNNISGKLDTIIQSAAE